MSILIPPKLQAYMDKVETETGRKIEFQTKADVGASGMIASYVYDPDRIVVRITPSVLDLPDLEDNLAHEITHGYLRFGKNYVHPKVIGKVDEQNTRLVNLLGTMIEDIVVNRIIQDHGFNQDLSYYMKMMKRETDALSRGKNFYEQFQKEPIFMKKFKVFRYILAWGTLKYQKVGFDNQKTIKIFLRRFKQALPDEYREATKIKKLLEENDIFTAGGYEIAINETARLWGLDALVAYAV